MTVIPELELSAPTESGGQRRVEGNLKAMGDMPYAADLRIPGSLHVAVLRSPFPHARIVSIDTAEAKKAPGVVLALTGADVANIRTGRGLRDVPLLAVGKARFAGEMVAAVVADDPDAAEEAINLVRVEYEPLPAVFDPEEALRDDAVVIHDEPWTYAKSARGPEEAKNVVGRSKRTRGGDVEAALASSDRVFEHTFRSPKVHQGYIEPHCVTAYLEASGTAHIWSCNKSPYLLRQQMADTFDMPVEQVHIHTAAVGGDFGGKGSPMEIPLCLELSRRTGKPVRRLRTYGEELIAGDPAHAMVMHIRMGVSHDGHIQALEARTFFNAGAYGGFTPSAGSNIIPATSYRIPAAELEVIRVYTNEVPTGNFRAPGAPQTAFGIEAMMDLVAHGLGLDPIEFRRRNLLRTGEETVAGEVWPEERGIETLNLAESSLKTEPPAGLGPNIRVGRGVALYDRPTHSPARTSLRMRLATGGAIEAEIPVPETGTGSHTMFQRVLSRILGVDRQQISIHYRGTAHLPYDSGVGGQRVTVSGVSAAVVAANEFKRALAEKAAPLLDASPDGVELAEGGTVRAANGRQMTLAELAQRAGVVETTSDVPGVPDHDAGATNFAVQIAQVGVDTETGQVSVYQFVSAHDVAEVIEPVSHRGQIEGGIAMGVGFALSEDLGIVDGLVTAAHMGEYKMPTMADMPPLTIALLPDGIGVGPLNVKSIGEMGNVPAAPAIANAVSDALGVCMDSLPLTAEKVLAAVRAAG
jgi:CO/xanthine dehydrogenase Mo-binding subunit